MPNDSDQFPVSKQPSSDSANVNAHFRRSDKTECEIRSLAEHLLERVDWQWTRDRKNTEINQSWTPEAGFKRDDWDGYTEGLILYVMAAASTSYPLPRKTYTEVAQKYRWRRNAGVEWIHAAPLFIHLFPQAWIDLRGLDDGYIGRHGPLDYFRNTQHAIFVQRVYAFLNPHGFAGYGKDIWGLSACEGPDGERRMRNGSSGF